MLVSLTLQLVITPASEFLAMVYHHTLHTLPIATGLVLTMKNMPVVLTLDDHASVRKNCWLTNRSICFLQSLMSERLGTAKESEGRRVTRRLRAFVARNIAIYERKGDKMCLSHVENKSE
jgi:hypothetical protein